jgi:DNA-binding transcriptional LysR family regulator
MIISINENISLCEILMENNVLNPIWLQTFRTLVEVGHFTQTAEKLFMTQPGVSQHINKLELACGHDLIKRYNKTFEVTEQGRRVYQYALQMEAQQSQLIESLNVDDSTVGQCRISCSGSMALHIYPQLLNIQKRYPQLTFHLEAAPKKRMLEGIQAGLSDLAIITEKPSEHLFSSEVCGEEPLVLVLPKALQNEPLTPELLIQCGLISHPDALYYLSLYFRRCGHVSLNKLNPEKILPVSYINQLSQILVPISQGIGFTVLPQSAVNAFALRESLHVHRLVKPVSETLYIVHKKGRELASRYQTVLSQLSI